MATVTYNPKEPVTVTLSYREMLGLRSLIEAALDYRNSAKYPYPVRGHEADGLRALDAMVRAVYSDMTPLAVVDTWQPPVEESATAPDPDYETEYNLRTGQWLPSPDGEGSTYVGVNGREYVHGSLPD